MKGNIQSRLGTETPLIKDLITDIERGEIKIPKFQRKFVWDSEQALNLLDSIANNYPVGSLLLWKTHAKLSEERNIGDFKLPEARDMVPTQYVLDGQQRITVIYSCLGASEDGGGFAAAYDVEEDRIVPAPLEYSARIFPLRWLFNTTRLLNFRTGLFSFPKGDFYQERLDAVIGALTNYRIPVVTLKELTVEEVCPIFERINSSGTRLSTYDLMVAATWSTEFDLNDEVDEIAKSLSAKRFHEIDKDTILKCLTAVQFGGIKKDQITKLRDLGKAEMENLVGMTKAALLSAVDLLSTEFEVYSWDFLPYEALVIVLCYIFAKAKTLSEAKICRVRQWFWRASFGERYRVGGENYVSRDLELIREFVVNEKGNTKDFGEPLSVDQWKITIFRSSNSRSRAFILMLASKSPLNLTNGAKIDTAEALSKFNKKEFHHIYPRAFLKRSNTVQEENCLVNICMLAASENKAISDADPRSYLPTCIAKLREQATKVFESNLMPNPNIFDYCSATYEEFLDARVELIANVALDLCEGIVP
jgi:hypothetical protein